MKVKSLSRVWRFATLWTVAYQAPPSMGFSRQEYWNGQVECHFLSPSLSLHIQFCSVQSLSRVRLSATPWITACQALLSVADSQSSLRLTSIESMMPSSYLILCHPLLLLPPIPPSIRVFSNESTLRMRWPKYWSFSFSIIPLNKWNVMSHDPSIVLIGI